MAKKPKLEESLSALNELSHQPLSDESLRAIRAALSQSQSSALADKAACVAAKLGATDAIPDLIAAFDRLMPGGAKADKGCAAMTSIIKALNELEHDEAEPYLKGVSHCQMEPAYGGPTDTADILRAECALGLARIGYPEIFFVLVSLLVDPEISPRRAAITALQALPCETSELLLRMKILTGDADICVIGDAVHALMAIAPESSVEFVGKLLSPDDYALAEEAALALGQSRKKEAYDLLLSRLEDSADSKFKMLLLYPIGFFQTNEAFEFLLEILVDGPKYYASTVAKALSVCASGNKDRKQRIQKALMENPDINVSVEI